MIIGGRESNQFPVHGKNSNFVMNDPVDNNEKNHLDSGRNGHIRLHSGKSKTTFRF